MTLNNTDVATPLLRLRHFPYDAHAHARAGAAFLERAMLPMKEFMDRDGLLAGALCDWQAAALAVEHLRDSLNVKKGGSAMSLLLSAYLLLGNYVTAEEVATEAMDWVFGDDRMIVCQLLTGAQLRRGETQRAVEILNQCSPREMQEAGANLKRMSEEERDFEIAFALNTLYRMPVVAFEGYDRDNHVSHCQTVLIADYMSNHMEGIFTQGMLCDPKSFRGLARKAHGHRLARSALLYYGLAVGMEPDDPVLRRGYATALALLGEHEAALDCFLRLIEQEHEIHLACAQAGLSAIGMMDIGRLGAVIGLWNDRLEAWSAPLKHLAAFYLERTDNLPLAVEIYQRLAQDSKDPIAMAALDRIGAVETVMRKTD